MLIDIHKHQKNAPLEISDHLVLLDGVHFIGVHPWFIDALDPQTQFTAIKNTIINNRPLLIGETGLDRLKSTIGFETQLDVFKWHIDLSLELQIPLVVHCLKSHSDLLHLLKEKQFSGRILIHDYSGGEKELKSYANFDVYFSFGRSLKRMGSKAQMVFKKVPVERVFLETDDADITIQSVYEEAKLLRPEIDWEKQIENNLAQFFNKSNDISTADFIKNFYLMCSVR